MKRCLLFASICGVCSRHCVPVVQLLFLHQLGQDLAEQLDNEWRWQVPFFEANVPPSDAQLRKFLAHLSEVQIQYNTMNTAPMQGVQSLDQCIKECGAQESECMQQVRASHLFTSYFWMVPLRNLVSLLLESPRSF